MIRAISQYWNWQLLKRDRKCSLLEFFFFLYLISRSGFFPPFFMGGWGDGPLLFLEGLLPLLTKYHVYIYSQDLRQKLFNFPVWALWANLNWVLKSWQRGSSSAEFFYFHWSHFILHLCFAVFAEVSCGNIPPCLDLPY